MKTLLPALLLAVACSPKAVPKEDGHPADPASPTGPEASPSVLAAPEQAPEPAAQPTSTPDPTSKPDLLAAEKSAFERARPVLERHCASCHRSGGKKAKAKTLEHFSLDTYPPGGHHAKDVTATLRAVLGVTGKKKATMPKDHPGAVTGDELAAILSWADAYDRAEAAGLHQAADKGHKH